MSNYDNKSPIAGCAHLHSAYTLLEQTCLYNKWVMFFEPAGDSPFIGRQRHTAGA